MERVKDSNIPVNRPGLDEVAIAKEYWEAKQSPSVDSIRERHGLTWPRLLRIADRNKEEALRLIEAERFPRGTNRADLGEMERGA